MSASMLNLTPVALIAAKVAVCKKSKCGECTFNRLGSKWKKIFPMIPSAWHVDEDVGKCSVEEAVHLKRSWIQERLRSQW